MTETGRREMVAMLHIRRGLQVIILVGLLMGLVWVASDSSSGDTPTPPGMHSVTGAFVAEPASAWEEIWQSRGTLYAATTTPGHETTHLWAVGDGGRLMRTVDGGRRWHFSRLPGRPTLHAVVFSDAWTGMAAGEAGALFRTQDGGDTWKPLPSPTTATVFVLDMADQTIWLAGEEGLFISRDGGNTWRQELMAGIRAWTRWGNLWAAGTGDGHVILSADGGQTWHDVSVTPEAIYALSITNGEAAPIIYAAGSNGFLARSHDGGATWEALNTGKSLDLYALAPAPDGTMWAAGTGGWVYHITNTGVTAMQADEDERTLYALIAPQAGVLWAVGDGPDVVRSEDDGATWSLQNGGRLVRLRGVTFITPQIGWAVGERERNEENKDNHNAVILYTEDGGHTWQVQPLPQEPRNSYSWLDDISCVDELRCWVGGRNAIFHTENGGVTWERQRPGLSKRFYSVLFPTPLTGFVGGSTGLILKTVDGGRTWTNISSPTNNLPPHDLSALGERRVAAALDQGYLLYTFNGGRRWVRRQAPYTTINGRPLVHLRGVAWTREYRIWVTGYRGYLATFNPQTFTWSYREGGTKSYDWFGIAFGPDEQWGFRVGGLCEGYDRDGACVRYTGGLIAVTDNWAESWRLYTTGTPGQLWDLSMVDRNHVWAVGDEGVILRYRGREETFALRPEHTPLIDGDTWDWTVADTVAVDRDRSAAAGMNLPDSAQDASVEVKTWWDPSALYVLAEVKDDRVGPGDALTIVWDGLANGLSGGDDLTLRFTPTGEQSVSNPDVRAKVRLTPGGWRVEMRVSADALGGDFQIGREMRWNIVLTDADGDNTSTLFAFGRAQGNSDTFGRLILLDRTVSLQKGANRYSWAQDVWISNQWNEKGTNWAGDRDLGRVLYVRGSDLRDALLRFDTSFLPAGLDVQQATLKLYADLRTGGGTLPVEAYPLKRAWRFDEVTGVEAMIGTPWGAEGANDTTQDRWATPVGTATADTADTWITWDVSEAVRYWLAHPDRNFGLILKSFQPGAATVRFVGERNGVYDDKRPIMEIRYAVPTPQVTPTPSPTPSPTPTPTPTPNPIRPSYFPLITQGVP